MADGTNAIADRGSAEKILFDLQVEQHNHDEKYHREIARLPLHQRLNHMALHFAKYAGKIAGTSDASALLSVYVDVLVIALSTANILNVALWDLLENHGREYPGLLAFGRSLALDLPSGETQLMFLRRTVIAAGRMAAACEKIDHLEEVPFRSEMRNSLAELGTLALAHISSNGVDAANAVRQRLASVKQRLKLHGRI